MSEIIVTYKRIILIHTFMLAYMHTCMLANTHTYMQTDRQTDRQTRTYVYVMCIIYIYTHIQIYLIVPDRCNQVCHSYTSKSFYHQFINHSLEDSPAAVTSTRLKESGVPDASTIARNKILVFLQTNPFVLEFAGVQGRFFDEGSYSILRNIQSCITIFKHHFNRNMF